MLDVSIDFKPDTELPNISWKPSAQQQRSEAQQEFSLATSTEFERKGEPDSRRRGDYGRAQSKAEQQRPTGQAASDRPADRPLRALQARLASLICWLGLRR